MERTRHQGGVRHACHHTAPPGYTLIELMVVVAIVGILAAIAIPTYIDFVVRSEVTEAFVLATPVEAAAAEAFHDNGYFPVGTNTTYSIGPPPSLAGHYVASVAIASASGASPPAGLPPVISVTFNQVIGGIPSASHTVLTLTAVQDPAGIDWVCGYGSITVQGTTYIGTGTTVPVRYLPPQCR